MSTTILLALGLWLSGAFVEYKIVRAFPPVEAVFRGLPGIVISIVISMTLGFFIAPAAGVAVALGATMGLATNEFTYKLFSRLEHANNKRKETITKISEFKSDHPTLFNEAVQGIRSGVKVIVTMVLFIVWIFGLPVRIVRWTQSGYHAVKAMIPRRTVKAI